LLIADDHYLVRDGMRALLEGEPDLAVVAEAQNGQEAIRLSRLHKPDLVLMDARMPILDGLQATRALKEELPQTSVLIITAHVSQEYLLEAIRVGAAGYILKGAPKHELLYAVRGVLEGEHVLDRRLSTALLWRLAEETGRNQEPVAREAAPATSATAGGPQRQTEASPGTGLFRVLTSREIDILRLVVGGRTNREIASELGISISTVKTHVQRIISKLEVSDRTQAAVKAVELGLSTE
jgi:DNA-binding NarL/FixJ family response regulator